jgi:hypothetical protein
VTNHLLSLIIASDKPPIIFDNSEWQTMCPHYPLWELGGTETLIVFIKNK